MSRAQEEATYDLSLTAPEVAERLERARLRADQAVPKPLPTEAAKGAESAYQAAAHALRGALREARQAGYRGPIELGLER